MQSSVREYDKRPQKRMRLGTRSCTECRRRKVRCIFNPGSSVCKECTLHESVCIPQQASQPKKQAEEGEGVKQRLDELEGMVRHLYEAIDSSSASEDLFEIRVTASEALKRFGSQSLSPSRTNSSYDDARRQIREVTDESHIDRFHTSSGSEDGFEGSPLLNLFKEAMYIQRSDDSNTSNQNKRRMKYIVASLKNVLPSFDNLGAIFKFTEPYWPIWTDIAKDFIPYSASNDRSSAAREFILDSLRSGSPMSAAKAVLFLCLCIQQLHVDWRKRYLQNIQMSHNNLINHYLDHADALLTLDERIQDSLDGIECRLLQLKIYFNMGKPRKAFYAARSALTTALFLGLHRPDKHTNARKRDLWAQVWQGERIVSTVVGLPSATSDSHPGISEKYTFDAPGAKLMHRIAVICGHLNERNQDKDINDYSATAKLSQELQACIDDLPPGFLETDPTPDMPLDQTYYILSLRFYYYTLVRTVHSPYIFQTTVDKNSEFSRRAGLDSCRKLMQAYEVMRVVPGSTIIVCDVMDYIAFVSALIVIVTLFSQRNTIDRCQEVQDWELINSVIRNQRRLTELMECSVADQSIRVLEYLSAVYHGTYDGPATFETVIPYVGKVRIQQFKRPGLSSNSYSEATTETIQSSPPIKGTNSVSGDLESFSSTVEFSTNLFGGFNSDGSIGVDYFTGEELGVDWTSILEIDGTYEWNQLYNGHCGK